MFEDETTPKADAATKWFFQMIFFAKKKILFLQNYFDLSSWNRKEIPTYS